MTPDQPIRLVLFMTRGVPLATWDAIGSFTRETALYRRLAERGVHVDSVSWGGPEELAYAGRLPGMTICCNRWRLPRGLYERLIPWLHAGALRRADLIKTNQTDGADVALAAARRWGKPLVARCGYMWSKNCLLEDGPESPRARRALAIEERVFGAADRIVVTTEEMREDLARRFPLRLDRIETIPNYVDVDAFCPAPPKGPSKEPSSSSAESPTRPRLVFVGRLSQEKNLFNLLEAAKGLDVEIELIGQGPLEAELRAMAGREGVSLTLAGRVANEALPERIQRATLFVLPSLYEGHPKTLIEAMACGAAVLATDVSGIRQVVRHGRTGWLVATDAAALREGLRTLLADAALRERLGAEARRFAVENYALGRIVERELALYASILASSH
jgi:glycosyltransferase involved in cell wall biosynthesis